MATTTGSENESLPTACTPMQRLRVWLQLQRLSLSAQAAFSLQRTLYCRWSNNRKCKSHTNGIKRPMSVITK